MKRRKTLKQLYKEHETGIHAFLIIVLFAAGFLFSWNFIEKPMSDSQFEMCEQIARDVYEQKGDVIVEVPEGFSVCITETTITVKADGLRSVVEARLRNGELVMTRNFKNDERIFGCVVVGILFIGVDIVYIYRRLRIYF